MTKNRQNPDVGSNEDLYRWLVGLTERIPEGERWKLANHVGSATDDPESIAAARYAQIMDERKEKEREKKNRRRTINGHLTARYEALRRESGACQCCGARAADGAFLQADHIYPASMYPERVADPDNYQVLCEDCNVGKSNLYEDDWRQ